MQTRLLPSEVRHVLLPGHVLHLLQLLPVVLNLRFSAKTLTEAITTLRSRNHKQIQTLRAETHREVDVRGRAPVLERRQVIRPRGLLLHVIPA